MYLCHVTPNRYRKFGHPYQQIVRSESEIAELCSLLDGYRSCYISSCEFEQRDGMEVAFPLYLLLDFDAGNGYTKQDARMEAARCIRYAQDKGWSYMATSTGCKGYHVIYEVRYPNDLYETRDPRLVDVLFRKAYKQFHEKITKDLALKTLDPHVKDYTRLIRIPGTMNPKCDVQCVVVAEGGGWPIDIMEYAPPIDKILVVDGDEQLETNTFEFPCLERHIRSPNPTHEQRVLFVKMRLQQGKSAQEIFNEVCRIGSGRWLDWDIDITRYMVAYYAERRVNVRCHSRFCTDECYLRRWTKNRR